MLQLLLADFLFILEFLEKSIVGLLEALCLLLVFLCLVVGKALSVDVCKLDHIVSPLQRCLKLGFTLPQHGSLFRKDLELEIAALCSTRVAICYLGKLLAKDFDFFVKQATLSVVVEREV